MASYNLEGGGQMWYIQVQNEEGMASWRRFSELLNLRFGPPIRSNPLDELMACKWTGTVAEYQDRFEALLPRVSALTEAQKVQAFTAGLQPLLSLDVEMHNPQSLVIAMSMARKLELREQYITQAVQTPAALRLGGRGLLSGPAPSLALLAPPTRSTPPATGGQPIRRLSQSEMEEHRRLGLCFNCNEKFARGHNRVCQRIFLLDLVEDDEEAAPDDEPHQSPIISLLAMAGVQTRETMQVHIQLGGNRLLALLDSGSTHNFVFEEAAGRTSLKLNPRDNMKVTMANGKKVPCPGIYRLLECPFHH